MARPRAMHFMVGGPLQPVVRRQTHQTGWSFLRLEHYEHSLPPSWLLSTLNEGLTPINGTTIMPPQV